MLTRYHLKRDLLIAVLAVIVVAQAIAFTLPPLPPMPAPEPLPAVYYSAPSPSGLHPEIPPNEPPLELPTRRETWRHPRTGTPIDRPEVKP